MKHIRWRVLAAFVAAAVFAAMTAGPAVAGDEARTGTSGAGILRVPVGPRGVALSGAVIADASGVEAMFWNPAGVTSGEGTEAVFSTMNYLVDSRIHFAGITHRFGDLASVGFSAKALSFGDIAVTTEAAGGPTGEVYSPTFSVIGFTAARQLSQRADFGLSVQIVNESIRSQSAVGVAFDLGFQYNTPWRGIRFGAVMKNFGPKMSYEGADFGVLLNPPGGDPSASNRTLVTESASFDLPSSFQLGVAYSLLENAEMHRLDLSTTFQSNAFTGDAFRGGAEYAWQEQFFLRGGIVGREGDEDIWGGTFGGGIRVDLGESDLTVDYALQATSDFFNDLNLVSMKLNF